MELDKLKILIVDDEKELCEMLSDLLSLKGAICSVAYNGEEALKILSGNQFDLVITDLKMPILDGKGLVLKMREKGIGTPVICITGYSIFSEQNAIGWGANGFLEKPIDMAQLIRMISNLCK